MGHKRLFVITLGTLGAASFLLCLLLLGSRIAPLFFDSMNLLVLVLGGLVVLWSLANMLVTTFFLRQLCRLTG
jgi:hypothetical protein